MSVTSGGTAAGRYEIHWFATAADGAVQEGVLDFTVTKGDKCPTVVREDVADDVDLGFDVTGVETKRVKGGALLSVATTEKVTCAAVAATQKSTLSVQIDTNSDRLADLTGRFLCKGDKTKLKIKTVDGVTTGALPAGIAGSGVQVKLPRHALVGHVDVWVESLTDNDECESKICLDRAPNLGLVTAY